MTDPMYLLDFRRMTVEKIDEPKPPPGFRDGQQPPWPPATQETAVTAARPGEMRE